MKFLCPKWILSVMEPLYFFRNVGNRAYFRRMQRSSGRVTINNESLGKLKTGCIFHVDVHTHCTATWIVFQNSLRYSLLPVVNNVYLLPRYIGYYTCLELRTSVSCCVLWIEFMIFLLFSNATLFLYFNIHIRIYTLHLPPLQTLSEPVEMVALSNNENLQLKQ